MTTVTGSEIRALLRACDLASLGAGSVLPNPVVGCVLLAQDGTVVGEGFHRHAGGPHAEIAALSQAGDRARGATAIVTLEPCNHVGRTGPCSEALIAAGIGRVVVAVHDPWAPAAGGIARLRAAGVDVVDLSALGDGSRGGGDVAAGSGAGTADVAAVIARAEDVNRVWLTAVRRGRPFVTLKMATTVDGRVAAPDGSARWISSVESRRETHGLRNRVDCIAVGVGTVLADDPQLTARDADGSPAGRQPLRVIFDSHGRTPEGARVRDGDAPTLIADIDRFGADAAGHVDAAAVLAQLYREGRRHLLLEGGPRLAAAMLDLGMVDEVLLYLAPLLLGAGRSALDGGAARTLADARRAEVREVRRAGPDVVVRYRLGSLDS